VSTGPAPWPARRAGAARPELVDEPVGEVLDGRLYTDGTLAGAIYFMTPLSLKYVLERLPDQLAAAVAGEAPQRVVTTEEG
jgi:hypothetical protein